MVQFMEVNLFKCNQSWGLSSPVYRHNIYVISSTFLILRYCQFVDKYFRDNRIQIDTDGLSENFVANKQHIGSVKVVYSSRFLYTFYTCNAVVIIVIQRYCAVFQW